MALSLSRASAFIAQLKLILIGTHESNLYNNTINFLPTKFAHFPLPPALYQRNEHNKLNDPLLKNAIKESLQPSFLRKQLWKGKKLSLLPIDAHFGRRPSAVATVCRTGEQTEINYSSFRRKWIIGIWTISVIVKSCTANTQRDCDKMAEIKFGNENGLLNAMLEMSRFIWHQVSRRVLILFQVSAQKEVVVSIFVCRCHAPNTYFIWLLGCILQMHFTK